jgi:hypothetical protein
MCKCKKSNCDCSPGSRGPTGTQGPTGAQGPTGSQGSTGPTGSPGPVGFSGFTSYIDTVQVFPIDVVPITLIFSTILNDPFYNLFGPSFNGNSFAVSTSGYYDIKTFISLELSFGLSATGTVAIFIDSNSFNIGTINLDSNNTTFDYNSNVNLHLTSGQTLFIGIINSGPGLIQVSPSSGSLTPTTLSVSLIKAD